ncbi:MAG: hypothetical protein Aurels2KO_10610 [Aureliella sp.]
MGRKATRPIPPEIRSAFYLAAWDLAWSGHFYRQTPGDADSFLNRFGSGSIVARRHGLTILWLTAIAGRFNELANLHACDVDGHSAGVQRSKRGQRHSIAITAELIECTGAWHRRVGQIATGKQPSRERRWCKQMLVSQYLLPSAHGGRLNCDVFNRDVATPLGKVFGIHLTSHCFRDTACQQAMAKVRSDPSLDVRAVQSLMGHKSITTTQHYLRKQQHAQLCLGLGGES